MVIRVVLNPQFLSPVAGILIYQLFYVALRVKTEIS